MKVKFNWGSEKGNLHVFQVFPWPQTAFRLLPFSPLEARPPEPKHSAILCKMVSLPTYLLSPSLLCALRTKVLWRYRPHSNLLRATPAWWQLVIALRAQVGTCHLLEGCQYCCQGSLPPTLCWGVVRPAQVGAYIGVGVACQNHGGWPETRKHWN